MTTTKPADKSSAATRGSARSGVHRHTRDAQLESRCQRFVEVAQALFLERGFAHTSVNEIVRRAGGSLATLYSEFGTKEELFEAVMNRRAATMFTDIINSKSQAPDVATELLRLAKRIQTHMLSDNALAMYRLAVHEGPKFPAVRKAVLINGLREFLQRLAAYFTKLRDDGRLQIDNPDVAAELFLTLVQGQLRTIAACGDAVSLTRRQRGDHIRRAVDVFLSVYPVGANKKV